MNNFDLYKTLNFIVNKDVYAQAMNESEFDLELKSKNIRHFRNRLGLPEGYKTGAVTQAVGTTRLNETDLSPFLIESTVNVVNGIATLTGIKYLSDFYTATSRSSDIISRQEISNRLNDPQTKPTSKDLCAYIVNGGMRVFPADTTTVNVIYYREPVAPVFVLNTNEDTLEFEYDATASTELEWDDANKLDIMHMILVDLGINIARGDVTQLATKLVETGK